jgi:hypothetical protein
MVLVLNGGGFFSFCHVPLIILPFVVCFWVD